MAVAGNTGRQTF